MLELSFDAKELSWDEIIDYALQKRQQADKEQFEWGDIAIEITRVFGAKKLRDFASSVKIPYRTLCRYRDVSKAYTLEQRDTFSYLSWTQFRALAGKENRIELLERASDSDWTPEKLEVMTKDDQTDVITEVEDVPRKPKLQFCLEHKKWFIPAEHTCPKGSHE
jgi:hypothetical protein